MPPKPSVNDPVLGPLTDDLLTPDVRVYQRLDGHRFSSDDVATAFVAWSTCPEPSRVLDLGCGLGSVLLLLAWKMPEASLVGIEVQDVSFALLERNVARNGLSSRVSIRHGDLRDPEASSNLGTGFDLVTGTPPYFPPGAAIDADDAQRAHARIEYRGGVEAYVAAAAPRLAPHGTFVLCGDARASSRVDVAANHHGLCVRARCDVFPRAGAQALFAIWTLGFEARALEVSSMTLRDGAGMPTEDADRLRMFSGFPSLAAKSG
ncbi:MAG: methyltransferase domain-containing protein [Polyangiaceae bacterium]|nr:methyltransferase domain-containing protein [Polyangiaceae bacterium]